MHLFQFPPDRAGQVRRAVEDRLHKNGFQKVEFIKGRARITTRSMGEVINFSLKERRGAVAYYREATGGALLVMEFVFHDDGLGYRGYCPITLFGVYTIERPFKYDAGVFARYRHEGAVLERGLIDKIHALIK